MEWFFIIIGTLLFLLVLMRVLTKMSRRRPQKGRYFRSQYREHWNR